MKSIDNRYRDPGTRYKLDDSERKKHIDKKVGQQRKFHKKKNKDLTK